MHVFQINEACLDDYHPLIEANPKYPNVLLIKPSIAARREKEKTRKTIHYGVEWERQEQTNLIYFFLEFLGKRAARMGRQWTVCIFIFQQMNVDKNYVMNWKRNALDWTRRHTLASCNQRAKFHTLLIRYFVEAHIKYTFNPCLRFTS